MSASVIEDTPEETLSNTDTCKQIHFFVNVIMIIFSAANHD